MQHRKLSTDYISGSIKGYFFVFVKSYNKTILMLYTKKEHIGNLLLGFIYTLTIRTLSYTLSHIKTSFELQTWHLQHMYKLTHCVQVIPLWLVLALASKFQILYSTNPTLLHTHVSLFLGSLVWLHEVKSPTPAVSLF